MDLPLVGSCFSRLFKRGEARFPRFDFITGKQMPEFYTLRLKENTIIIVEGIHALNDRILEKMPTSCCQKIYISLLSDMERESGELFLRKQDVRLLRRIVRRLIIQGLEFGKHPWHVGGFLDRGL